MSVEQNTGTEMQISVPIATECQRLPIYKSGIHNYSQYVLAIVMPL